MDVKYQEKFRCQHNKEKIHQLSTHILLNLVQVSEPTFTFKYRQNNSRGELDKLKHVYSPDRRSYLKI